MNSLQAHYTFPLVVLAGGLVVLIVDSAVQPAVVAQLPHVVHQLVGLQVHALAAQDLQRVAQAQALLLMVSTASVCLVDLYQQNEKNVLHENYTIRSFTQNKHNKMICSLVYITENTPKYLLIILQYIMGTLQTHDTACSLYTRTSMYLPAP